MIAEAFLKYLMFVTAEDHTAKVQRIVSSLGQDTCRAVTKGQQRRFVLFAFCSASRHHKIVLWTMCWFGLFLVVMLQSWSMEFLGNFRSLHSCLRHGWQNKLSSTMVFSLSVLQHYAISYVNRVCHQFRSVMIMPWAVCPSSVFKNWFKLPNSEWNADGAAWFTTIWVDRSFEDPCNALAMLWPQGLQLSEGTECLRTPAVFGQWPQGSQLSEWTEGLRTPAILWQWPFQAPGWICKFQSDQACSAS